MDARMRYSRASYVAQRASGLLVFMALAQRDAAQLGPVLTPYFGPHFSGSLSRPMELRGMLLGLRDVVTARFHRPDLWRHIDPVVTSGIDRVRLECFSSCASVYARVDLHPEAFERAEMRRFGTTNVDFSPAFAEAVARTTPTSNAEFQLDTDSVTLWSEGEEAVEKRVRLPERWIRGFLQIQAISSGMWPELELDARDARALVAALPKRSLGRGRIVPGRRPRFVSVATHVPGSIEIDGAHRLHLMTSVLAGARALRVYRSAETGATLWEVDLEGGRFNLTLSSNPARGFSGDGEALRRISANEVTEADRLGALEVAAALNTFTAEEMSAYYGGAAIRAHALIDSLSAHGMLGFEQSTGRYFHRVLPFVRGTLAEPTRERGAKRIVAADSVELMALNDFDTGWSAEAQVKGYNGTYQTSVCIDSGYLKDASCTCPWAQQHRLERGPCKHQLATRIAVERQRARR